MENCRKENNRTNKKKKGGERRGSYRGQNRNENKEESWKAIEEKRTGKGFEIDARVLTEEGKLPDGKRTLSRQGRGRGSDPPVCLSQRCR